MSTYRLSRHGFSFFVTCSPFAVCNTSIRTSPRPYRCTRPSLCLSQGTRRSPSCRKKRSAGIANLHSRFNTNENRNAVETPGIVKIRSASAADVPVLSHWDKEPHVIAATSDDPSMPEEFDWQEELAPRSDGTQFFIAEVDHRPIGVLCVIDPERERTHYWGEAAPNMRAIDIWIGERDMLGKGYGSQMMTWVINLCFHEPQVTAILVDPLYTNVRAHRFYKGFGFHPVHRRQFDPVSDCLVMRLDREDREKG